MWTPTTRRQDSVAGLRYGSDLTDAEWSNLHTFLPSEGVCGRKRAWPMREIVNAICYVLRGGIAWRLMPDGSHRGVRCMVGSPVCVMTAPGESSTTTCHARSRAGRARGQSDCSSGGQPERQDDRERRHQ